MKPGNEKRRKIVGVGLIIAVLIIVIIILQTLPGNDSQTSDATNDVASPETAQGQTEIIYDGFDGLTRRGLTEQQMNALRYAFYVFNASSASFVIDDATIKQGSYDSKNPTDFIPVTFAVRVQGASYDAKLDKYTDLRTIRLRLFKPGEQAAVFDSQPVNGTELNAYDPNRTAD